MSPIWCSVTARFGCGKANTCRLLTTRWARSPSNDRPQGWHAFGRYTTTRSGFSTAHRVFPVCPFGILGLQAGKFRLQTGMLGLQPFYCCFQILKPSE
jgi:hypothetical protein